VPLPHHNPEEKLMSYTLPHPQRTLAVPLATLAIGLGAGISGALILTDDDPAGFSSPTPAAEVAVPKGAAPVPERITSAPTSSLAGTSSSYPVPVPERATPAPFSQPSGGDTAPVPERISGARAR
jgi:hypothetical protein